ncbi:MAG: Abi family protein, partial [Ruminococcus sp.]|nr:Abi family protein [Ruminococcus sp.]
MAKPFLTYDEQIEKLIHEKKLIINDSESAKEGLKNIGYFSLIGGYKTPFIDPMTRIYQDSASFNDILALY